MNKSTNDRKLHREFITPDNAVMLSIDHQAAIMTGISPSSALCIRGSR